MPKFSNIAIVIPVFEATKQLKSTVEDILLMEPAEIIIVDDGSTKISAEDVLIGIGNKKITILRHQENKGKGSALKTAFKYCLSVKSNLQGIITMDADGQHLTKDVISVQSTASSSPKSIVIGSRDFKSKNVPLRSQFGNLLTRFIFKVVTGIFIQDTQSGLRFIPLEYLSIILKIKEDRYDFELAMLTKLSNLRINIIETRISTVYIDNNQSSHFRPIIDSTKVYIVFLRYCSVSLSSAIFDFAIFIALFLLNNSVFLSTYIARVFSSAYNFTVNRKFTFKANNFNSLKNQIFWYFFATFISASLSASILSFFEVLSVFNLLALKALVDSSIFTLNFVIQHFFIFKKKSNFSKLKNK